MSDYRPITDSELHAFLDGALDPARSEDVAAQLEADPALAARMAGFDADKALLKQVYGPLADRPLPPQWLALAHGSVPAPRRSWRMVGAIAAAVVVALAAALTWRAWQPAAPPGEIVQAALYVRQNPATPFVSPGNASNAGRYDKAVSNTIALPVKVPDLGRMGYRLAGIHLYPKAPGGSAAELLYRDGAGRLFTLYMRRSDGTVRFDQFAQAGLRVCIWQDDRLGMVMAGNVSTAAMQRLASLAYTGITS